MVVFGFLFMPGYSRMRDEGFTGYLPEHNPAAVFATKILKLEILVGLFLD